MKNNLNYKNKLPLDGYGEHVGKYSRERSFTLMNRVPGLEWPKITNTIYQPV
jgi:hypothetical protein